MNKMKPAASETPEYGIPAVETGVEKQEELTALSALDREFISLFVRFVTMMGMPRSLGEIYGLLFSSPHPLPFDIIVTKLGISTGSASQGLRFLREMGAIRVVYQPKDRRDHFTAEIAVQMLIHGFLREKVEPRLLTGFHMIDGLRHLFEESKEIHREHYRERIELLIRLKESVQGLLPRISNAIDV